MYHVLENPIKEFNEKFNLNLSKNSIPISSKYSKICQDLERKLEQSTFIDIERLSTQLSMHSNMTMDYVFRFDQIGVKLNWQLLSKNASMANDIMKHHSCPLWDWQQVSKNSGIRNDFLLQFIREKNWNCDFLSANVNISDQLILENPDLNWNFKYLSKHYKISINCVLQLIDKPWNWAIVFQYKKMNLDTICDLQYKVSNINNYIRKGWCFYYYHGIPLKYIEENLQLPWHFTYLMFHPQMNIQFIKNNIELISEFPSMNINILFKNKQIYLTTDDLNYLDEHFDVSLNAYSKSRFIDLSYIIKHRDQSNDDVMYNLSINSNLTMQQIDENIESETPLDWNFALLVCNPNFNIEFYEKYKEKFDELNQQFMTSRLQSNPFNGKYYILKYQHYVIEYLKPVCDEIKYKFN